MTRKPTRNFQLRASLIGILGWLIPLIVALLSIYWLYASRANDDIRNNARARDDIRAIGSALMAPRSNKQSMPSTAEGLQLLVTDGILPHLPNDPWGRAYQYRYPGTNYAWELYSLGADGKESADDIVSWNLYGGR